MESDLRWPDGQADTPEDVAVADAPSTKVYDEYDVADTDVEEVAEDPDEGEEPSEIEAPFTTGATSETRTSRKARRTTSELV